MRGLLYTVAACQFVSMAHFLFEGDATWLAFFYGLMAQQFLLTCRLYTRYGYEQLPEKSVAFVLCFMPLIESVLFMLEEQTNPVAYMVGLVVLCSLFVGWLSYAVRRRYQIPSAPLNPNTLCILAKHPNTLESFLYSLFKKDPYGRRTFYVGGVFYGFRKRGSEYVFKRSETYPTAEACILDTGHPATPKLKKHFEDKLGSLWSWRNNCATVLPCVY